MEGKLCSPSVFRADKKLVVKKYEGSSSYRFNPSKLKDVRVSVIKAMNYEGPDMIRLEYMGISQEDPEQTTLSDLVFDIRRRPEGFPMFNVTLKQHGVNTAMTGFEKEDQLSIVGPNFQMVLEAVDRWGISGLPICKKVQSFLSQQVTELNSTFEIICRGMYLIVPEKPLDSIRELSNGTWCM